MSLPLISIITVVYNGEKLIADTLRSAVSQTYKNIELVIVDGGSKDRTPEIAREFSAHTGTLISEPDKGIYDAMNKGIKAAKGEWLYFLNAGDRFYDDRVLEDVFTRDLTGSDFIYARMETVNEPTGINYVKGYPVTFRNFYFTYPLCHQATFTSRRAFERIGLYNADLSILADNDWQLRFFKDPHNKAIFIDRIVAYYDIQGTSYHKRMKGYREFVSYSSAYFPFYVNLLNRLLYPVIWLKVKFIRMFQETSWFKAYRRLRFGKRMAG